MEDANKKVFEIILRGAEVYDCTSATVDQIGLSKGIQEGGRYRSVRRKIMSFDQKERRDAMRRMSAAVEYVVGSVHAVTDEGQVVIASKTGSQLSPSAYGVSRVIWIVGAPKIVKNLDPAFTRIRDHCLPLEDARAKKSVWRGKCIKQDSDI